MVWDLLTLSPSKAITPVYGDSIFLSGLSSSNNISAFIFYLAYININRILNIFILII